MGVPTDTVTLADGQPIPKIGFGTWKAMFLTAWAASRPFVWLDDELTDADRRWVTAHRPARALPHRVDP